MFIFVNFLFKFYKQRNQTKKLYSLTLFNFGIKILLNKNAKFTYKIGQWNDYFFFLLFHSVRHGCFFFIFRIICLKIAWNVYTRFSVICLLLFMRFSNLLVSLKNFKCFLLVFFFLLSFEMTSHYCIYRYSIWHGQDSQQQDVSLYMTKYNIEKTHKPIPNNFLKFTYWKEDDDDNDRHKYC